MRVSTLLTFLLGMTIPSRSTSKRVALRFSRKKLTWAAAGKVPKWQTATMKLLFLDLKEDVKEQRTATMTFLFLDL